MDDLDIPIALFNAPLIGNSVDIGKKTKWWGYS